MYKKIARIGPISLGIFYALTTLLMLIIVSLIGVFALPYLPIPEGDVPIDVFTGVFEAAKQGQGIEQLAIGVGILLVGSFLVGFVTAILYNIVAMICGGVKVRVTDLGYDDI